MSDYKEKFEKMRAAGNLAARTLDMLTDHIKPGAPLVGFNINFAFSGIQIIFCLPSLNSPGL